MVDEPKKVKNELNELLSKRASLSSREKPEVSLDSKDGVKDELKRIVENTLTKAQDRLQAMKLLIDLAGYKDTQSARDLDRMSNEDLVDLVYTVVLPAIASHGVYVRRPPPVGSPHHVQWFGKGHMPKWSKDRAKKVPPNGEIPPEMLCRRCKKRPFRYLKRLLCQACFVTLRKQFPLDKLPTTFSECSDVAQPASQS